MTHLIYNDILKGVTTMEMGQKIYHLRAEKGLTLEELGNMVGVGKSTVRKWENGMIANMKRDKILKVAEVFNVSPGYLMGWEDSPTPLSGSDLSYDESRFLALFRSLNADGQRKMMERAEELRNLGYIKGDNAKMA